MKLNPSQHSAVVHEKGPLLIVAGAGTGKTTVITERIKYLISQKKVDPQQIFATTFTQKASQEMLNRLDETMPLSYTEPWLGTFHSLCDRLLKTEGLEIGLTPNFKILTATDQWIFIKKHLFDFKLDYYRPLGNPAKFISALIKFFSRLQDEDISPQDFLLYASQKNSTATTEEELVEASRLQELSNAFSDYHQFKNNDSVLDFGDLLTQTLKLFRTRKNILSKYQTFFQHILVDEFQDTNYAQYQLIKLLSPSKNNPNLVVVGDDNQSIYKFRGASISNILEFKADYPQSKTIILDQNYRSPQKILDAAYKSIKNNDPDTLEFKLGINKKLKAANQGNNSTPSAIQFPHMDLEIEWTINHIALLIKEHSLSYKDIAILTRANSQLEPYAQALKIAHMPYQLVSNRGLFDQPEIRPLLAFLQILVDPEDSISLFQLLSLKEFKLSSERLYQLLTFSKQNSSSLYIELKNSTIEEEQDIVHLIEDFINLSLSLSPTQLLFKFINTTNYLNSYIETESLINQLKIKNINLLFQKIQSFEYSEQDKSLVNFLDTLNLWLEAGENPPQAEIEDVDTITLSTIHSAKGLEYSAVFIPSLVAGRFPSNNRTDPIEMPDDLVKEILPTDNAHLKEERRLFYVALTRAKNFLYLTYSSDYGGKKQWRPSGFIKETGISPEIITPTQTITHPEKATLPPVKKFKLTQTSYSQIDTFLACPLRYKYRYILKIPVPPYHTLSFGKTIHNTLEEFHRFQIQGKILTEKELLESYKRHFIDQGYESPQHKTQRYQAGLKAMKSYHQNYSHLFGLPQLLEQSFKLKLTKDVILTGKIDRIDLIDKTYHLIDYKTGNDKTQKDADKDEQLTIYALASKEVLGIDIDSMSLYFIESGNKLTTKRTPLQLAKAKEKLIDQVTEIQTSTFPAKPSQPFPCGFCEYARLCPFAAKPS